MKKHFKILLFTLVFLTTLTAFSFLSGCKAKETDFFVVFDNQRIENNLKTVYINSNAEIDILSKIKVVAVLSNKQTRELKTGDFKVEHNISETFTPGDEYNIVITYKDFDKVQINIVINKLENTVTLNKTSKVYDKEKFTTQDLGISALNEEGLVVTWFKEEQLLQDFPVECGNYKIRVQIPQTKAYKEVDTYYDIQILQAEPSSDMYDLTISNAYLSTDKLSNISLPENFAWKNPGENLKVGLNNYSVIFTPENKNYKQKEFEVSILVKQAFNLPVQTKLTFNGEFQELTPSLLIGFDENFMELIEGLDPLTAQNAGSYKAKIKFIDGVDAVWSDGSTEPKVFEWAISKLKVKVPYYKSNFAFMSLTDPVTISWEDESVFEHCYLLDTDSGTNSITFTYPVITSLYFCLIDTNNTEWEDGTTEMKSQPFEVQRDVFEKIKYTPYNEAEREITIFELVEMKSVCMGSKLWFQLKDKSDLVLKFDGEVPLTPEITATKDMSKLEIRVFDDSSEYSIFGVDIPIYFYSNKVKIDEKMFDINLIDNDIPLELKENQTSVEVELGKELEGFNFIAFLVTEVNQYERVYPQDLKFTFENVTDYNYIYISEEQSDTTILQIYLHSFTRIDHFEINRINGDSSYKDELDYYNDGKSYVNGLISNFNVVFKNEYKNCTFTLLDKNHNEFTSFKQLTNKETFYVLIIDEGVLKETICVEYSFMADFSLKNSYISNIMQQNYNSVYVQTNNLENIELSSYNDAVNLIFDNSLTSNITNYGFYKLPLKITYEITSNFKVEYNTSIILNYSKSLSNFVLSESEIIFSSPYMDNISIPLNSKNISSGLGAGKFRALITDSNYDISNVNLKDGYSLTNVELLTENNLFGYKITFNNGTIDEICYVYEIVSGIYNGDASLFKVEIESYITDNKQLEIINDTISTNEINPLTTLLITPNNIATIAKLTNEAGDVVYISILDQPYKRSIYFTKSGTYTLLITAPNGNTKTYTIIIGGENVSKPLASVKAGTGADEVTLTETIEYVDFDLGFAGDLIIEDEENLMLYGYFGSNMQNHTIMVNGKECLSVNLTSGIIDYLYLDENCILDAKEGTNILKVLQNDNEQKYVVIYAKAEVFGIKAIIPCYLYLEDNN